MEEHDPMSVTIIPRFEWSGLQPRPTTLPPIRPASTVFILNTSTPPCHSPLLCAGAARQIQIAYLKKYTNDLRYNFMVGGDGIVYEVRGWDRVPLLPKDFAKDSPYSISVAYIGRCNETQVPEKAVQAVKDLIHVGILKNQIAKDYNLYNIMINKLSDSY